jgi:hypothetical protein
MWEAEYDKKTLKPFFINIERREENSALAKKLCAKRLIDLYKFYKARRMYYDKIKIIRENNNLKKRKKSFQKRRSSVYSIKSNFDFSKRASVRKNRRSSIFGNNDILKTFRRQNTKNSINNYDFKISLINMDNDDKKKNEKDFSESSQIKTNKNDISKFSNDNQDNKNNLNESKKIKSDNKSNLEGIKSKISDNKSNSNEINSDKSSNKSKSE